MLQETQAIILKSDPLAEADKIITFYSPQFGKIKGVAAGARRPKSRFGSSLEVLSYVQIGYFAKPKGLSRINQTEIINFFPKIREDLDLLYCAIYAVDVVNTLTELEDPNPELFRLLQTILESLNTGISDQSVLLRIFEMSALTLLGYSPQLTTCIKCNKSLDLSEKTVYNVNGGGLLCPACAGGADKNNVFVSGGSISFLRQAVRVDLNKINRLKLSQAQTQEVKRLLRRHLLYHLKQDIKSYRFLDNGAPSK